MKFYKQQHEFYCGIDLHANSMHVCVVDHVGNKLLHKNFDTKKPERFLTAIRSYSKKRSDHRLQIDLSLFPNFSLGTYIRKALLCSQL